MSGGANIWVVDLSYSSKSSYSYGGGGAYYSTNRVPTIKEMWGNGERQAERWLEGGLINHEYIFDNFRSWVRERKIITYNEAMDMKKRGILRFNIRDSSNPPAAAAAAETYSADYKKGTKGPCWDGYTYVGDTPYSKGSCVKNAETYSAEIGEKYVAWQTPTASSFGWRLSKHHIIGEGNKTLCGRTIGYDSFTSSSKPNSLCKRCERSDDMAETYSAEGKPPKQAKGLVVDNPDMAAQIRSGDKTMVVWNKPLNIAKKRFILLSNRKAYAYIEVGAMQEITLPKFRKLENQHRISGSERSRLWKGHQRLYAWPVKVLKKFDRLYSTNAPLRPQKVVPRVKTYSAESKLAKPMNAAQRAIYQAVLGARMREQLKKQEIMRKIKELQQELESAMRNSVRVF